MRIIRLLLIIIFTCLVSSNKVLKEPELTQDKIAQEAQLLLDNYKKAIRADELDKERLDNVFFESFPNSFSEMNKIFGYDDVLGEGPLYFDGFKIIEYFSKLNQKDRHAYYYKYINICIDGKWEADNIVRGFGVYHRILNDTDVICELLDERTDEELKSVFNFIFDGPHPDNKGNHKLNRDLQKAIPNKHERLRQLINYSLEKLINNEETTLNYLQGVHEFKISFAEWGDRIKGSTCKVKIKGNNIIVKQNSSTNLSGGEIIIEGKLLKHLKTRKWIITDDENDIYAHEIGGCTGIIIINLENKMIELC